MITDESPISEQPLDLPSEQLDSPIGPETLNTHVDSGAQVEQASFSVKTQIAAVSDVELTGLEDHGEGGSVSECMTNQAASPTRVTTLAISLAGPEPRPDGEETFHSPFVKNGDYATMVAWDTCRRTPEAKASCCPNYGRELPESDSQERNHD